MESDKEEFSSTSESEEEEPEPTPPRRQTERTPIPAAARANAGATGGGKPTPTTRRLNPGAAKLPLKIRTLDGKTYNIQAHTDWPVRDLKKEFEEWRGEGSAQCMLQYRARRLNDDDLLSAYKMEPDSVIQANFRSTGGEIIINSDRHLEE